MAHEVDYLIVGGGLAGHILQIELERAGRSTLVIDQPENNISSVIAAGMVNPIAGKFMNTTWRAKEIFADLVPYYQQLERELETPFFNAKLLKRVFAQAGEQNTWLSKAHKEKYKPFCSYGMQEISGLRSPFGVLQIRKGGQMNVSDFLQACKRHYPNRSEHFDPSQLNVADRIYKDVEFGNVVFAEGIHALQNPLFPDVQLVPMKGELIDIETDLEPFEDVVLGPVFLFHVEGRTWRVGATYEPRVLNTDPTETKLEELTSKLEKILELPYTIKRHYAGVRPASVDRRPIIGRHPDHHHVFMFNGFGSKGISLIPIHAKEFVAFVTKDVPLHPEVAIERFEEQS